MDTIQVRVRTAYGRQIIDIMDPTAQQHLHALTGCKTLTIPHIRALRSLGLTVTEVPPEPRI